MSSRSWFDSAQLLAGERLIRSAPARVRVPGPPGWWDGRLVLTTDRIFFLATSERADDARIAFWLTDVVQASARPEGRLLVFAHSGDALFGLEEGPLRRAWPGRGPAAWCADIARAQRCTSVSQAEERGRQAG
ncbi:MAG: hypothetical protein HYX50_04650 [Chloroflexi bacterium]|nr:hypothetical protein [Chloroflexota bacterium]